ncbi:MAG: hypothetical protein E6Q77_06550 [Rhizobium sp.]|nr:MAG: hypothetical protein E6Q77_06550 [Rhizobium sp.]
MANIHNIEYTDTFGGEANYCWVRRAKIHMPELTHYGYDGGTNYAKASAVYNRELMKRAKAKVGLTGVRGRVDHHGDCSEFRPYGMCTVLFVNWSEDGDND